MKYLILFFLFNISVSAQVGIGTTNPQNDLHVAGATSTIRLEGLNATNNALNVGTEKTKAFVDGGGELTLDDSADNTNSLYFLVQSGDNLSSEVVLNHYGSNVPTIFNIYNEMINLESQSYIEVKYNFSYGVYRSYSTLTQTGSQILDGESRIIKTYFTIDDDPTQYGQISQIYYNNSVEGGIGYFFNNGQGYIRLPPGEHVVRFYAQVLGATNTVIVFGGRQDSLKIRLYQ